MFLLLFLHATNVPNFRWGVPPPDLTLGLSLALSPFRMPLLFFTSGLLLHRTLAKPFRTFLSGKVRNLMWPYFIWAFILLNTAGFSYFIDNYARDPLAWVAPGYLWFIFYLFVFYFAARGLRRIPHWAVCLALLLVGLAWPASLPHSDIPVYAFYFFAGAALSRPIRLGYFDEMRIKPIRILVYTLSGGAILTTLYWSRITQGAMTFSPEASILVSGGVVGLVVIARRIGGHFILAPIRFLGAHSIVFYLSHWPIMIAGMSAITASGGSDPWTCAIVLFSTSILVGCALTYLRRFRIVDALFTLPTVRRRTSSGSRRAEGVQQDVLAGQKLILDPVDPSTGGQAEPGERR